MRPGATCSFGLGYVSFSVVLITYYSTKLNVSNNNFFKVTFILIVVNFISRMRILISTSIIAKNIIISIEISIEN